MKRLLIQLIPAFLLLFITTGANFNLPAQSIRGRTDEFSYLLSDSNQYGGPDFYFEDISNSGTEVELNDGQMSSEISLGFSFRFYDVYYSSVFICANGFVTFLNNQTCAYVFAPSVPTAGNPDSLIVGWGTDLNPEFGGTVHYQILGSSPQRYFIIQFTAVPHFDSGYPGSNPVTFQIKLFEDSNHIEIHYQNAPSDGTYHSIGVENQIGSTGVMYYRDTVGLATPLAIKFTLNNSYPDTYFITIPINPSNSTQAKFEFEGTGTEETDIIDFRCKLDHAAAFTSCTPPVFLNDLLHGEHTFQVYAVDNEGLIDLTPATYTWFVDVIAPDTYFTLTPSQQIVSSNTAFFEFIGVDGETGVALFECQLDGASFAPCTSPLSLTNLPNGPHALFVRAVDWAGNSDLTPASFNWTVSSSYESWLFFPLILHPSN